MNIWSCYMLITSSMCIVRKGQVTNWLWLSLYIHMCVHNFLNIWTRAGTKLEIYNWTFANKTFKHLKLCCLLQYQSTISGGRILIIVWHIRSVHFAVGISLAIQKGYFTTVETVFMDWSPLISSDINVSFAVVHYLK